MSLRPEAASAPRVVAVGRAGVTVFRLVGVARQNGLAFTFYGYLTSVSGLPATALFTSSSVLEQSEATARLTFSGSGTIEGRSELKTDDGDIISLNTRGTLDVFVNEAAGAALADPASFGRGRRIATIAGRFQFVNNIQAPNRGVVTITADLVQAGATPSFTLAGGTYQFGRRGLREGFFATGQATRTQVSPPVSSTLLAGGARAAGA